MRTYMSTEAAVVEAVLQAGPLALAGDVKEAEKRWRSLKEELLTKTLMRSMTLKPTRSASSTSTSSQSTRLLLRPRLLRLLPKTPVI